MTNQQTDERLDALLADYFQRLDQGEAVAPSSLFDSNPDLEAELREFFDAASFVEQLAGPTHSEQSQMLSVNDTARSVLLGETIVSGVQPVPARAGAIAGKLPQHFGRYEIQRLLGQGAMGSVYLAYDPSLQRQVALKIPKFSDESNPDMRDRFLREARSAATLRHANICPVYDVGRVDGVHYITMAYIEGRTLAEELRAGRTFAPREIATIVRKLALALGKAHSAGVIHRDLKPGNIMLDAEGEPVLMDFGLAYREATDELRLTKSGMIVGSPAYMSPEQIEGDPAKIGAASDIYSLGVVLYEMITGKLPFQGTMMSVIGQIATTEPTPVGQWRKELADSPLERLCRKMLAKSIDDRPQTMQEAARALDYILSGLPGGGSDGEKERMRDGETACAHSDAPSLHPSVSPSLSFTPAPAAEVVKYPEAVLAQESRDRARMFLATTLILVVLVGFFAAAAGVVYIATNQGTLEITSHVDNVQIEVIGENGQVRMLDLDTGTQVVRLPTGDYSIVLSGNRNDVAIDQGKVTVKRGGKVAVTAQLATNLPRPARVDDGFPAERPSKPEETAAEPSVPKPLAVPSDRTAAGQTAISSAGAQSAVALLDARHLAGWRAVSADEKQAQWKMEGGWLLGSPKSYYVTATEFDDFELTFEWKTERDGIGGVYCRAPTDPRTAPRLAAQYVLAFHAPDVSFEPRSVSGSVSRVLAPVEDASKPLGEVNTSRIVCRGTHIEHWLNERKVLEYDVASEDWKRHVKYRHNFNESTPLSPDEFAQSLRGRIVLEAVASRVWFRNMRLQPLVDDTPLGDVTQLYRLDLHQDWVMSVAFAPGDKLLASSGADATVRLWDPATGKQEAELKQHGDDVRSVFFRQDGARFATAAHDGTIKIWDTQKREVLQTLAGHKHKFVTSVLLTPDGKHAVSAADDSQLILWDLASGTAADTVKFHSAAVSCLALAPDGKTIASGGKDNLVILSEITGGKLVRKYRLPGHKDEVRGLAFSPDGSTLVSGGRDGFVRLWDARQGKYRSTMYPAVGVVYAVAVSPDSRWLAVGGGEWKRSGLVKIYDFASGKVVARLTGYPSFVHSLAFTSDSRRIATGGGDKTVRIWQLGPGIAPSALAELRRFKVRAGEALCVVWTPDGRYAIASSSPNDNAVYVWDAETGTLVHRLVGHTNAVMTVSVSPDGSRVLSAALDNSVREWDLKTGQELHRLAAIDASSAAVSPDGHQALVGSHRGKLALWDLEAQTPIRELPGHEKWIDVVRLSKDGSRALTGGRDDCVRLWDVAKGTELQCLKGHASDVKEVAFLADETQALSASVDGTVRIWNLQDGHEIKHIHTGQAWLYGGALLPNGRHVLSAAVNGTVAIWKLEDGSQLGRVDGTLATGALGLALSPSGQQLLTAHKDGSVRVWRIAEPGPPMASTPATDSQRPNP